jgi:hypothetical protein
VEALSSCETSVLARATWRNISKDAILQSTYMGVQLVAFKKDSVPWLVQFSSVQFHSHLHFPSCRYRCVAKNLDSLGSSVTDRTIISLSLNTFGVPSQHFILELLSHVPLHKNYFFVVRVSGCRPRGPEFGSRRCQIF